MQQNFVLRFKNLTYSGKTRAIRRQNSLIRWQNSLIRRQNLLIRRQNLLIRRQNLPAHQKICTAHQKNIIFTAKKCICTAKIVISTISHTLGILLSFWHTFKYFGILSQLLAHCADLGKSEGQLCCCHEPV
jgi:hypothetical protein